MCVDSAAVVGGVRVGFERHDDGLGVAIDGDDGL
jgi:hypothetical protein